MDRMGFQDKPLSTHPLYLPLLFTPLTLLPVTILNLSAYSDVERKDDSRYVLCKLTEELDKYKS